MNRHKVFETERNMIGAEDETEKVHGKFRPRFFSSKSHQACDGVDILRILSDHPGNLSHIIDK